MSSIKNKVTVLAVSALVATGATLTVSAAKSNCPVEKCYGIAKKLKNDCGTSKHACAAQAKTNADPNDWIFVMKGNCNSIVGGSLKPPKAAKK